VTVFVLIAAVLAAAALAFVLPPLLRANAGRDVDRARANLGVLKDQLAELEADHRRGAVADAQYAEIKAELERRVLEDVQAAQVPEVTHASRTRWPAVVVAVVLPLAAAGIYSRLGDPAAFDPGLQAAGKSQDDAHVSGAQLEQMVVSLRKRLEKEPDNAEGWLVLARSYYQMRKFDEASAAFAKLVELVPDDAGVLADYADAAAMAAGRKFDGKPRELVQRALKLDPTQWKALAMAGTDAFEQKNYKLAVAHWENLRAQVPGDSPIAKSIAGSIAEARQLGGMAPDSAPLAQAAPGKAAQGAMPQDDVHKATKGPTRAAAEAAVKGAPAAAAAGGSTVSGTVTLSPALKAKAAPTDRVFIFARPAGGSRMPLALTSVQVKDLPARFTLDDSMGMSPDFKLSSQAEVIVGARVSKTGQPMPASGDFEGLSTPVKLGANDASITIDKVLP
jgi:cytochrome c-type biogenesis protein CcmH